MPNVQKSNFFTLNKVAREDLLTKYEWCGVRKWEQDRTFSDVADDSWWIPPKGFHFIPELLEISALAEQFQALEADAHSLAEAIYPARHQHDRVIDPCLIFLDSHASTLIKLCLSQHRLPRLADLDAAAAIVIADGFLAGELSAELADWLPEELTEHLHTEFPGWLPEFILQLLRWKAPSSVEQVIDDGGQPLTGADARPSGRSHSIAISCQLRTRWNTYR